VGHPVALLMVVGRNALLKDVAKQHNLQLAIAFVMVVVDNVVSQAVYEYHVGRLDIAPAMAMRCDR
jgi:hypothetical protein